MNYRAYAAGYNFGYSLIGTIILRVMDGFITLAINRRKGYDGGFWWGFLLGNIGIIIVACRARVEPEYSSSSQSDSHQSPQSTLVPTASEKPVWICVKCGKENGLLSKFCAECEERRHYKWICANCGKENAPEIKFCSECGNEYTDEQECIPTPTKIDEAFLKSLMELDSAGAMLERINAECQPADKSSIRHLIEDLQRTANLERLYGKAPGDSRRTIQHFLNAGGKHYRVERSGDKLICPNCGNIQDSTNSFCSSCSVPFCD